MTDLIPRLALDMYVLAQGVRTGVYRVCDELFPRLAESERLQTGLFCRAPDEVRLAAYLATKDLHAAQLDGTPDAADILLSPFGVAPFAWLMNPRLLHAHIIYDLIAIKHPEFFTKQAADEVQEIVDSIDEQTVVFAISEFTKNDLLNSRPDLSPSQITVIPLAAGPAFKPCNSLSARASMRVKYGIPPEVPYVLSLATLEIRKNLDQVVKAFVLHCEQESASSLHLVLSGMSGWKLEKLQDALSAANMWRHRIVLTGFIDETDLAALYSDALCFAYLSRYEGFGLPPLEAMACGTPVVSSNNSSLPEVVGDAGIMLAAEDTQGVADAILRIAKSETYRERLSQAGLKRAQLFNWDCCAEVVIDTLVKAAQHHFQRPSNRRRLLPAPGAWVRDAVRADGAMEASFLHYQNGSRGPHFDFGGVHVRSNQKATNTWPKWIDRLTPHSPSSQSEGGLRTVGIVKSGTSDHPLVSYITVVRNNQHTLERTIDSVQRQTYPNVEHIVVDGASTDGTLDLIRAYGDRLDYFVSEPDLGLYDAVNKAVPLARGQLICILNSDDWLEPNAAEVAVRRMRGSGNSAMLLTAANVLVAHGKIEWPPMFVHPGCYLTCANDCHNGIYATPKAYEDSGPYDVSYKIAADFKWIMTCLDAGVIFVYTRELTVNYSLGGTSGDAHGHSMECMRVVSQRFPFLNRVELAGLYDCFFYLANLPDLDDRPASRTQFLRNLFARHAAQPDFLAALSWASISKLEYPADPPLHVAPEVSGLPTIGKSSGRPSVKNRIHIALRKHPKALSVARRLYKLTRGA